MEEIYWSASDDLCSNELVIGKTEDCNNTTDYKTTCFNLGRTSWIRSKLNEPNSLVV